MAIVSVGTDLVQIERLGEALERRGERFLRRVFTDGERAYCEARNRPQTHYAGRFAVKEAVMKVLGTGWSGGVRWVDIEVERPENQAPAVVLHGETARIAEEKGIRRVWISITHDGGLAMAVAIAEG
ncbi:MAG: holo-[acyl-carrier-protein] synthase [Planctomycetes bacterium]|jgi:holo-[acyl-carrier protein] synthase|nr:holo-[acyl-carrier-protein] synthase [Planctomycetota bacterium]MDP6409172.1 holo-ACP synthase [Planctomycetota bacterium]